MVTIEDRIRRKTDHVAAARACGGRLSRSHPAEADPVAFLASFDVTLTRNEQAAREALLPGTWQGAFAQGWRSARG